MITPLSRQRRTTGSVWPVVAFIMTGTMGLATALVVNTASAAQQHHALRSRCHNVESPFLQRLDQSAAAGSHQHHSQYNHRPVATVVPTADESGEGQGRWQKCLANVFYLGASKTASTTMATLLMHEKDTIRGVVQRAKLDGPPPEYREAPETHHFDRSGKLEGQSDAEVLRAEIEGTPAIFREAGADNDPLVLHYTPHYLYVPYAAGDVRRIMGPIVGVDKFKFLVTIREPVSRSVSSYWYKASKQSWGEDRGSLEDMMQEFRQQMDDRRKYDDCMQERHQLSACFDMQSHKVLYRRHIDKSIYVDQIQRWADQFPPHSILVVRTEDLARDSTTQDWVLAQVLRFLRGEWPHQRQEGRPQILHVPNISPSSASLRRVDARRSLLDLNAGKNSRQVPTPPREMAELTDFFRPYNRALNELLGVDVGYPT